VGDHEVMLGLVIRVSVPFTGLPPIQPAFAVALVASCSPLRVFWQACGCGNTGIGSAGEPVPETVF